MADGDNDNILSDDAADLLGAGAALGFLIAARNEIAALYEAARAAGENGYRSFNLWLNYGLPGHVRPWIARALWVNVFMVIGMGIYVLAASLAGGFGVKVWLLGFGLYVVASTLLIVVLFLRWLALGEVRRLPKEVLEDFVFNAQMEFEDEHERPAIDAWESDPANPGGLRVNPALLPLPARLAGEDNDDYYARFTGAGGIWNMTFHGHGRALPPAPHAAETEAAYDLRLARLWERNIEHAARDWQRAMRVSVQAQIIREFGPRGQLGLGTLGLVFLTYAVHAVLLAALASWAYAFGAGWVWTLAFTLASAGMFFLAVLVAALMSWALSLSVVAVVAITVGISKGAADVIGTSFPNLRNDEAKVLAAEVEARIRGWNSTFGRFFKDFVLDAAILACLAFFALSVIWVHPLDRLVVAGILLVLGYVYGLVRSSGKASTGAAWVVVSLISLVALLGITFRVIEYLAKGPNGHLAVRETTCVVYRGLGIGNVGGFFYSLDGFALLLAIVFCLLIIWAVRRYTKDLTEGRVRNTARNLGILIPLIVLVVASVALVGKAHSYYSYDGSDLAICGVTAVDAQPSRRERIEEIEREVRQTPPGLAPPIPRAPIAPPPAPVPTVGPECCPARVSTRTVLAVREPGDLPPCEGLTAQFRALERRQGLCR